MYASTCMRMYVSDIISNMKGRILQSHTSILLKCGMSCIFIKFKLGRVGMGRVLHLGPSWHGPSFASWAELAWALAWDGKMHATR